MWWRWGWEAQWDIGRGQCRCWFPKQLFTLCLSCYNAASSLFTRFPSVATYLLLVFLLRQPVPCCVNDPVPPIPLTACCSNQSVWICYLLSVQKNREKLEASKGTQVLTKNKQGTTNCPLGWLCLRVEVGYSYHMLRRTWSWIPGERLSLGSRGTAPTLSGWWNGRCTCLAMLKWLLMFRWFEFNCVCDLSLLWLRACVNKRARSLDTDSRWRPLL